MKNILDTLPVSDTGRIPIGGYKQIPQLWVASMATETGLLPLQSQPEYETGPMMIPIRRAETVFDALSSDTARLILSVLTEEPMTISGIAETVGTSMQNVRYHTTKLLDAEVITKVDTWYSEKGREMCVYGASCEKIILTVTSEEDYGHQISD